MNGAVEAAEATLKRPVELVGIALWMRDIGDMPFADGVALITRGFQGLGNRDAALVQVAGVTFELPVLHHVPDARLMRIEAGEQRGTRGAAAGRVVELREPQAALCQRVQIRRVDLAAVATDVGKAHVIGKNVNNVRRSGCMDEPAEGSKKHGEAEEAFHGQGSFGFTGVVPPFSTG